MIKQKGLKPYQRAVVVEKMMNLIFKIRNQQIKELDNMGKLFIPQEAEVGKKEGRTILGHDIRILEQRFLKTFHAMQVDHERKSLPVKSRRDTQKS